ncbi:MAG: hypothetical protein Q9O74_07775 [Planctomycetota bacterium]|nr:hypothetical protein [Planctomycetota bacterium]
MPHTLAHTTNHGSESRATITPTITPTSRLKLLAACAISLAATLVYAQTTDTTTPTPLTTTTTTTTTTDTTTPTIIGPLPTPTPAPGPYTVRDTGEFVIHDASRDKDLPVRVRAPAPPRLVLRPEDRTGDDGDNTTTHGPFPLIVFSHGMGGASDVFPALGDYLASHGYVVVYPTHADSIRLRREQAKTRKQRRAVGFGSTKVDLEDRVADVSFILDSLDEIEAALNAPGLIDREQLGMAGHSAGAMTTQAVAGLRFYVWGKPRTMVAPRLDAFAVISGQGTARRSIREDSWQDIDKPWLVITGSKDQIRIGNETPETRRHPYDYAPADGTKHLVFIEGATHSSYQGKGVGALLDGGSPDNVEWIVEVTNMSVLAFFDAYLKDHEVAKAWLDAGKIAEHPGGELEALHK